MRAGVSVIEMVLVAASVTTRSCAWRRPCLFVSGRYCL